MKSSKFLNKLFNEEKIELVQPSEDISKAYLIRSGKCITVAELAFNAKIHENAISEAYYSIYNSVLSLFFKCGIKCENHSGAVILIKEIFCLEDLYQIFSELKKDRIDNQYYVSTIESEPLTNEECLSKINMTKVFNVKLKFYAENLKLEDIKLIRIKLEEIKQKSEIIYPHRSNSEALD